MDKPKLVSIIAAIAVAAFFTGVVTTAIVMTIASNYSEKAQARKAAIEEQQRIEASDRSVNRAVEIINEAAGWPKRQP